MYSKSQSRTIKNLNIELLLNLINLVLSQTLLQKIHEWLITFQNPIFIIVW